MDDALIDVRSQQAQQQNRIPDKRPAAPPNLVLAALFDLQPTLLVNEDGKSVCVDLTTIAELVANPPPMLGYLPAS